MKLHLSTRMTPVALALALVLSGSLIAAAPALAQQAGGTGGAPPTPDESKTGAGPRGTGVGPSTEPGASVGPTSSSASQTGTGPRGSKAGPSTEPGSDTK
jgi:hypothetical protein